MALPLRLLYTISQRQGVKKAMIRGFLAGLWASFLFVCTCTKDLKTFIFDSIIQFDMARDPAWREFFIFGNHFDEPTYFLQKVGHFTGFFILSFILSIGIKNIRGIYFALFYAGLTEVLQLIYKRDGRLLDIFIDAAGILCAYLICQLLVSSKSNVPNER